MIKTTFTVTVRVVKDDIFVALCSYYNLHSGTQYNIVAADKGDEDDDQLAAYIPIQ